MTNQIEYPIEWCVSHETTDYSIDIHPDGTATVTAYPENRHPKNRTEEENRLTINALKGHIGSIKRLSQIHDEYTLQISIPKEIFTRIQKSIQQSGTYEEQVLTLQEPCPTLLSIENSLGPYISNLFQNGLTA